MTSPPETPDSVAHVVTTETVEAEPVDTQPHLELTADPSRENNAIAKMEGDSDNKQEGILEKLPPDEDVVIKEDPEYQGETEPRGSDMRPTEDAAIPELHQNMHSNFDMDVDPAQQAGLDALISMGIPIYSAFNMNNYQFPQASAHGLPIYSNVDQPNDAAPYLDPSPYMPEIDQTRIKAYAKLEFEDGEFYMNTFSLVIGRDVAAAKAALRRYQKEKRRIEAESSRPTTPVQVKHEGSKYSKSIVSESGGIVRAPGALNEEEERVRRRQNRKFGKKTRSSKKSGSTGSENLLSSMDGPVLPNGRFNYVAQFQTRTGSEADPTGLVDPDSLVPDPHECPEIGIHPPATTPISGYKSISRRHMKIAYNLRRDLFEAHIWGRNGIFVDEQFHPPGDVIELKSGCRLQIGNVVVRFLLPDVPIGEAEAGRRPEYDDGGMSADRYSEGGKEMSFDFAEPRDGVVAKDTSEEASEEEEDDEAGNEQEEDEDEEDLDDVDDLESNQMDDDRDERGVSEQSGLLERYEERSDGDNDQENHANSLPRIDKKRGPGRPPKNGIMSKREQQLAKKEALAKQKAQKTLPDSAPTAPPGKNKVGRPRKHPRPDTPPIKTEKRKYTKRKPKEPKDGEAKKDGSGGEEQKEKKEKKPKPPRSPTPEFNEADLSPEQLKKPPANYVTLIHEALTNYHNGPMSLPQIYRAIQRKYPYFVLRCSTNGWQSSVRHNLSQHHAFERVSREGKGWLWGLVEGVSIEKEKKRRTPPPPQLPPGQMHHQPIYQAGHPHHMMPGYPYGPGPMEPPPGYPMNYQIHPNMHHGPPLPQYMGPPAHLNGHVPSSASYPTTSGPPIPAYAAAIAPQLAGASTTYSSPYAPKPPASAPPQTYVHQSPSTQTLPQGVPPSASPPKTQTQPVSRPPQPTEAVMRAIEIFKGTLMKSLKEKDPNAEQIFSSAVNQVLGFTSHSTAPENVQEEQIVKALAGMLGKIPGSNITSNSATSNLAHQNQQNNSDRSSQSQPAQPIDTQVNSPTQQTARANGQEKQASTVMRPTFAGQGLSRPSSSVSRPSMMPPVVKRTQSGSPANTPANTASQPTAHSASPASASVPTTPTLTPTIISVTAPLSTATLVSARTDESTPTSLPTPANGTGIPAVPQATESTQLAGQKRPLDDADDMREFKRMSTSGPPQLKT
jgi:hypothetical protein